MNVNDQYQAIVADFNAEIVAAKLSGNKERVKEIQEELNDFIWEADKQMGN